MSKKLLPLLIIVFVAIGALVVYKVKHHKKPSPRLDTYGVYKFKRLPDGIVAKTGDIEVPAAKVMDATYADMVDRRNGLLAAMAAEQVLAKKSFSSATFGFKAPAQPLDKICIIYGLRCPKLEGVRFDPQQKRMLIVDGSKYDQDDLDLENLHWYALKTEIFNHVLANIRWEIRKTALNDILVKDHVQTQDLIEQKIMPAKDITAQAREHIKERGDTDEVLTLEENRIRDRAVDEYLEKNYLKLPIQVSVELPDFDFDMKWDWVAHIGDNKAKIRVIFVSDFFSAAGRNLVGHIEEYAQRYPQAVFGFRPYFDRNDRYQIMVADMAQCVWQMHSNVYWKFLGEAGKLGGDQKNFEKDLYKILDALEINNEPTKSCFLSRKFKDAVEYHLKWGDHLRILSGPVSIIGREVYIGPVDPWVLGGILSRQ